MKTIKVGDVVTLLRGSSKGKKGTITKITKKPNQVDVKLEKDGNMRYVGIEDVAKNETLSFTKEELDVIFKSLSDLNFELSKRGFKKEYSEIIKIVGSLKERIRRAKNF